MSATRILMLALGAVIFAAWAYNMFRVLFLLRKRAEAESGRPFPGPGQALRQWGRFFRGPEDKPLRQRLTGLTMGLLAWLVGLAWMGE
ncbi:hypothetical protein [Seohaeicola zhoushanensis]|uniref:Uncharacterized protein n=1 Tax=Seohaeicola zhoushanensis TaxID=1569283 RepID=A0A8J3H2A2_9RHOB|nr:hypothetical protein [Seohaeicola zhoushanensis]GHF66649.1 hypothetical protein GCM10017056_42340 [Seohaeicola zhoushanensis]